MINGFLDFRAVAVRANSLGTREVENGRLYLVQDFHPRYVTVFFNFLFNFVM